MYIKHQFKAQYLLKSKFLKQNVFRVPVNPLPVVVERATVENLRGIAPFPSLLRIL